MKREILFKAKRVDNGEWVEGLPCYLTEYAKDFHEVDGIQCDKTREYYDVNPETVCQFTGILDKNGNKIFEGDICIDMNEETRIIKYSYGAWSWNYYEDPGLDWKKTGNIHDK